MSLPEIYTGGDLFVGNGIAYVAEHDDDGLPLGERDLGNCTSCAITTDPQKLTKFSRRTRARNQLASVNSRRATTIALTLDDYSIDNLVMNLLGEKVAFTQSASTATDESIGTAWEYGLWYKLSKRSLSSVVVEHVVATVDTPLTVGVDYLIDTDTGRIMLLDGGAAVEAELLKISYSYAAISSFAVRGGTQTEIVRFFRFVGDSTHGPSYDIEAWKVNFTPNGELQFIQDEFGNMQLTGEVLEDAINHPTEPLYRVIKK